MENEILTGEKIQQISQIYIGCQDDFYYNPIISMQQNKHVYLDSIIDVFENPQIIFLYAHRMKDFSEKVHFFKNDFVLITHNSDQNIDICHETNKILNHSKLIKWYTQNLLFYHEKIHYVPIGLANSMWKHGNLEIFKNIDFCNSVHLKTKKTYFNFNIGTNTTKRLPCFEILKNKLEFLTAIEPKENLARLKEHEFCICPEGNGADTHRLWECLYLKTVPIVLRSQFIETLLKYNNNLPLVVLDSWEEYEEAELKYQNFSFENIDISFSYFINKIKNEEVIQNCNLCQNLTTVL